MTSRLPGGKADVLAGRDRGQRREPARVGAADVKPAELDALDQRIPSLRAQRQDTEAVLQGGDVDLVVLFRLGAEQPDQPAGRLSPGAAVSSSWIPRGAAMRPDRVERSQVNAITRLPSAQEGGPGIYTLWAAAVQVRVAPVARSRT
jgi:hypothetical protein